MSRLPTTFRLSLEKLDDRLCLSGTPLEPLAAEPAEIEASHVKAFSGASYGDFSAYDGFLGGVRVGDQGNDWLVGGTGQDVREINGNLQIADLTSVAIDPIVVNGDVVTAGEDESASGGAGIDVLIANTGYDRLALVSDELLGSTSSSHPGGANFLLSDGSVRF